MDETGQKCLFPLDLAEIIYGHSPERFIFIIFFPHQQPEHLHGIKIARYFTVVVFKVYSIT